MSTIRGNSCLTATRQSLGLLAVLCLGAAVTRADDWPQWNGPRYEMISRETGWSKDWTSQPPRQVWTREIGVGFSGISVVGPRIYTMGRDDDKDVVYCLDAATGEVQWTHAYPCELVANMHEGGPGATPTVRDGRVYTHSREGHVHCLDAESGSVIWKVFLPDITEIKHPMWGFTSSPIIVGEFVIIEAGRLVALKQSDGAYAWQTDKRAPGYGSAMQFEHGGKSLVATLNNAGLLVVDPVDGREVAFTEWKTSFLTNSTTPIYFDGKFFISTGYKRGCGLFQFNGDSFKELYTSREMSNHMNNSVYYEGHIFGVSGNSNESRNCRLVCLDAASGEAKWSKRGIGCGSLLIADGHIVLLSDDGSMTCGPANSEGFEGSGKFEALKGRCWTVPTLANGHIYCRTAKGKLVCLELPSASSGPASPASQK